MTLQPDYDSMIEQLLGDASLNDVQRAALRKAIECDTKARKELAQAERVERILRAEAERSTPSQATVERLLGYAIAELTVEESGQSADYPSVAEAKGSAGFSVAAWLTSFTVRVASAVRTNRVFALGSLGGNIEGSACEVDLEHPEVGGKLGIRRVDAAYVEIRIDTSEGADPRLAVILADGTTMPLKANFANVISTDMLPRKGLAPPMLEFVHDTGRHQ